MLELRNITKTFGDFTALDDLSMTVPKGTVYGLVGPNGAGKSTAIRHMLGVYRPDSGSVTLDGMDVWENPAVKARMGSIPDDVFYFPSATLEDMRKYYRGLYIIRATTHPLTMLYLKNSMKPFSFRKKRRSAASPKVCRSRRPST